jgi:Uri superfamily endonuclease
MEGARVPERASGAYILLVRLRRPTTLEVGRLGPIAFGPGNYVYIGSGMGGLSRRVKRHFRRDKKVKWHIDRLLAVAELSGAVLFPSDRREECRLARAVLASPGASVVPGFGSSDCRCPGHLVRLGALPFGALLGRLDGREPSAVSREPGINDAVSSGSRLTAHGSRISEASQ